MTGTTYWRLARDGDGVGLTLHHRHYRRPLVILEKGGAP
jgi:hypothetical protein